MACKATNTEQLENLIANKQFIFSLKPNQTQEDTSNYFGYTQSNISKRDDKYFVRGTDTNLRTTITTEIGKKFNETVGKTATTEQKDKWNQQAMFGTVIHEMNQNIINGIIGELNGLSASDALAKVKTMVMPNHIININKAMLVHHGFTVGDKVMERSFEGIREMLIKVYAKQRTLNNLTKTNGNVKIFTEQVLVDPKKDVGGTADFIALYSDNTADVIDFKTKIAYWEHLDQNGRLKEGVNWISQSKKDTYKLQLGEIARILKERYGVVRTNVKAIEFIRYEADFDKKTNNFKKHINRVWFGEKQDAELRQYRPFQDFTPFEDLNKFLADYQKRLTRLQERLKTEKENREELREKIKKLEDSKYDIVSRVDFENLFKYTNELLDTVTTDAINKYTISELRDVIAELKMLQSVPSATYGFRSYIKEHVTTGAAISKEIEEASNKLSAMLTDKISELEEELFNKRVNDLVNDNTGISIVDSKGNITPFRDEGFFGKWFNQLSQFENPIFQAFRSRLDQVQFDIRENIKKVITNVQDKNHALRNWMKQNNKSEKWLQDLLINKDKGTLVSELNDEWRKIYADLRKNPDTDSILQYYDVSDNYRNWYNTKLNNITNDTERQKFEKRYSLEIKNGKVVYPENLKRIFLEKPGNLTLKDSVKKKYKSDALKEIESIKPVLDFYNMLIDYNKEFRNILGVEFFDLPNTFIPNIRKDMIERITEYGWIDGLKADFKDMISDLNIREDDTLYGELEDGQMKRRIPKFFINPLRNSEGEVDNNEKSWKLDKSLILFSKMVYNFKYMSSIEAEVLALKDFLSDKGQQFITRNGKPMSDFAGNNLVSNIVDTDMNKIFSNFVDMYLYGINVQPTLGDQSGKIEKIIMKAKQYYTVRALGLNLVAAAGSYLAAKTQAIIEGNKGIIYNKTDYKDSLKSSYSDRQKFLAIYAYFDPMNTEITNFALDKDGHSKIGDPTERNFIAKYVNSRVLLRAFSIGDEHIDEVILSAMARNYYVDEQGNMKIFKNEEEKKSKENRSIWNIFSYADEKADLTGLTDTQKRNVIIAFRNAVQAGQSRIKGMISEEDKAAWQSQILGQVVMHFKSWMPALLRERFGKSKYNRHLQVFEMGKYVAFGKEFSNVDNLATHELIKSVIVPKLFTFIRHLATFGLIKGWHMNDTKRKQIAFEQWLDENNHYRGKITYEEWLNVQQKQLKSMMLELRILLLFAGLYFMLAGDWDDDGEKDFKKYWAIRKIVSILSKTQQEISFTYNPVDFAKMVQNPIPMIGLATDAAKMLRNTVDESRDVIFGENSAHDKTGWFYYGHKAFPGIQGASKFFDIFAQESGEQYK